MYVLLPLFYYSDGASLGLRLCRFLLPSVFKPTAAIKGLQTGAIGAVSLPLACRPLWCLQPVQETSVNLHTGVWS